MSSFPSQPLAMGGAQLPPVSASTKEFSFWSMIWHGKWLIFLALALGLGGAYWQYTREVPLYKSTAEIMISVSQSSIPIEGIEESRDISRDIDRQIVLIQSPKILKWAVEDGELGELKTFQGSSSLAKTIAKGLTIRRSYTEGVLTISFTGPVASDCPKIVNAVVSAYKKMLKENHEDSSQEAQRLLNKTRTELTKQLKQKEDEYAQFRAQSSVIWKADGETNVFRDRLQGIEERKSKIFLERTELQAEAAAIEKALASGGSKEALQLMVSNLALKNAGSGGPTSTTSVAGQLFPMLLEEQLLLDSLGPDHPKVLSLKKRIKLTRNYLQESSLDAKDGKKPATDRDFIAVYLDSLKQQIKLSELKEKEFNDQLEKEREQIKKTLELERKDESLKAEIQRIKSLYETIVKRLGEIDLVKDEGKYMVQEVRPASSGEKDSARMKQLLAIGGLIGLLVGLGLAFIRDRNDHRFLAPEDIQLQLQTPIVGHIPEIRKVRRRKKDRSPIDPMVCTYYQPSSKYAEAFRAVRTALYFSTQNNNHRVIQVTSPHPGDGKTTLITNLAVSIACSGKKVLLVDCDLRKPRVHQNLGLSNEKGLADTIAEGMQADPMAYVQETEVPNLCCLPSGPRPDNPSELLTSSIFEQFLELAREKYDYVLVDTPPVLAVTDASTVAARVDAVILTLRLQKNTRAAATRAREILTSVGGELIGVVVNQADQVGGYGYGNQYYGSIDYGVGSYGFSGQYGSSRQRDKEQLTVMYDSPKANPTP